MSSLDRCRQMYMYVHPMLASGCCYWPHVPNYMNQLAKVFSRHPRCSVQNLSCSAQLYMSNPMVKSFTPCPIHRHSLIVLKLFLNPYGLLGDSATIRTHHVESRYLPVLVLTSHSSFERGGTRPHSMHTSARTYRKPFYLSAGIFVHGRARTRTPLVVYMM